MVEIRGGGAAFPVVFFDGDRETEHGTVAVDASLGYRKFQALIAQRVGVAPHQISTSLVRRKKARASPEVPRKVPIDESSDFAAIARERDCFVLAVLRRSRRERKGRSQYNGDRETIKAAAPLPERTILKRIPAGSVPDSAPVGIWGGEDQRRSFQKLRERYLMAMGAYHPYTDPTPVAEKRDSPARAACAGCVRGEEFHHCVHDTVTVGFRTSAGPIQRPSKSRPQGV